MGMVFPIFDLPLNLLDDLGTLRLFLERLPVGAIAGLDAAVLADQAQQAKHIVVSCSASMLICRSRWLRRAH